MAKDSDISRRMDRVAEIVQQLDAGECSLEEGRELHEEAERLLDDVRDLLHEGDGEVIEIE